MTNLFETVASWASPTYRTKLLQEGFLTSAVASLKESESFKTHDLSLRKVSVGVIDGFTRSAIKFEIRTTESESPEVSPSDEWSLNHVTDAAMESFIGLNQAGEGSLGWKFDEVMNPGASKDPWLTGNFTTYNVVLPLPSKNDKDAE